MSYYIPTVLANDKIAEASSSDQLDPDIIAVSSDSGNTITTRSNGLYSGAVLPQTIYYVNSSGSDATTSGSKTTPFKTLDYAIEQVLAIAGPLVNFNVAIALQCGQSFNLNSRHTLKGNFKFAYYGDTKYGDFDGSDQGYFYSDLDRPEIVTKYLEIDSKVYQSGLDSEYSIDFIGVNIGLPVNPNTYQNSDYGTPDMILGEAVRVSLLGTIVNKKSIPSYFGLIGIKARSLPVLDQYASQFLLNNIKADNSNVSGLSSRAHFIHFYLDALVGNTPFLFATSSNSNNGYGLLRLNWTDTQDQTVNSNTVLSTFPTLPDPSYGLRNYFTNLQRDQQSRPLNVWSSRLF